MSYCRLPYYIYDAGDRVNFNFDSSVDNDMLDVFLYKLVLVYPDEFRERILNGRKIIMDWLDEHGGEDYKNWLLKIEKEFNDSPNPDILIVPKWVETVMKDLKALYPQGGHHEYP